jgi:hypothetical protein
VTEEELIKVVEEMEEMFGDSLPSPEHEPIRFAYYVKLYKFYKIRQFH